MTMFRALLRWVLAFLVLSFFVAPVAAQSDASQSQSQAPTLTFRQTVRRVIVDVTVHDANGKPVRGLTANDFSIIEDKQPQPVLSFDVYDFDKPSISRGPNAPPLPPNVFLNVPSVPEHGPLYVVLYDLVNTELADQMTARQQILKFIGSKPEGTRFAVFVNSDGLYLVQGFTADKDVLYAALDPKHPKPHVPRIFQLGRNYGQDNPYTTIDVLTFIGRYLDGIPGRKNLIWIAGDFPTSIFPRASDPVDAQEATNAELNALAQAEVAVFPVNVRGVVVQCEGCLTGARPNGGAGGESVGVAPGTPAGAVAGGSGGGPVTTATATVQGVVSQGGGSLNTIYAAQDAIATVTGGRAFYSDNDVSDLLEQATEDGANYYTLTYSPPTHDDGKCHNILVRVDKPKYQLSYRRSYCRIPLVSTATENSGEKGQPEALALPLQAGDVLQANMKQGAPMVHELVFSAHVRTEGGVVVATPAQMEQLQEQAAFFRTHRRNKPAKRLPSVRIQTYTIDYRVLDPQFKAQAERNGKQPMLEFAVAAFDDAGKVLNGMVNDGVKEASTETSENTAALYRLHQELVVPINAKCIRVGVRDRSNERIGTMEVPLPLVAEPPSKASTPAH